MIAFNTLVMWGRAFISKTFPPTAAATGDSLAEIIMSESINSGPDLWTGKVIHKIPFIEAHRIAGIILEEAPKYGLEVAMVAAGIAGESRFDQFATNPNCQVARFGESRREAFLRTDMGIAYNNAATRQSCSSKSGVRDYVT